MRRVLALDLGTKTGWATNVGGSEYTPKEYTGIGEIKSGIQIFDGEISGWRYLAFKQWLDRQIWRLKIDHIIYEETFSKSAYSSRILHGFLAMLQFTYAQRYMDEDNRLTMEKVHPSTLKKFATGNGHAKKDLMISKYREKFGYLPADNDEADALFLLRFAEEKLK